MAEQLNENLSKTEPSSPRTPEARLRPNAGPGSHSAPASGQNSATNLRKILEAKPFINLDSIGNNTNCATPTNRVMQNTYELNQCQSQIPIGT